MKKIDQPTNRKSMNQWQTASRTSTSFPCSEALGTIPRNLLISNILLGVLLAGHHLRKFSVRRQRRSRTLREVVDKGSDRPENEDQKTQHEENSAIDRRVGPGVGSHANAAGGGHSRQRKERGKGAKSRSQRSVEA